MYAGATAVGLVAHVSQQALGERRAARRGDRNVQRAQGGAVCARSPGQPLDRFMLRTSVVPDGHGGRRCRVTLPDALELRRLASAASHASPIAAPSIQPPITSVAQWSSAMTRYAPMRAGAPTPSATAASREIRPSRRKNVGSRERERCCAGRVPARIAVGAATHIADAAAARDDTQA